MVIKINPKFNQAQIKKFLEDKVERINSAVLSRLKKVGEDFVNNARSTNTYRNVTGNLRSSIGYVILRDGIQMFESFPGDKADGLKKGKESANKISESYPRGFVLICVAGMDYAAAVESRGKDVITGSSKLAESQLKEALFRLQNKL